MTTSVVRQCERRLTALGIDDIPDLDDLCRQIGALQGRQIRLVPVALPADRLCGLVVGAERWAAVYYHHDPDQPAGTLTGHQRHIVHHELAHLVWGHTSATGIGPDVARILAPSIDPAYVQRILGRTTYTNDVEIVAEVTASIWTARAGQRDGPGKITVGSASLPPGLAGAQLRREKLDPLWWFVVQTTPEVFLNQWFADAQARLTRCLVEIHDGLLALEPYFSSHMAAAARRMAPSTFVDVDAVVEATVLIDAAWARTQRRPREATYRPARHNTDPLAEESWLQRVAAALGDPRVREFAWQASQAAALSDEAQSGVHIGRHD